MGVTAERLIKETPMPEPAKPEDVRDWILALLAVRSRPLAVIPAEQVARQAIADYRAAWRRIDGWAPRRSAT